MIYLTLLLTAIFLILSAIHIYWALGGEAGKVAAIPVKDNGQRSFSPSKTGTLVVAVALFCFAVLVFCIGVQSVTVLRPLGWLLALVLFLRAIGDFKLVGFFKRPSASVFAKNDNRFYSPLCLFLAAGVLYISL